MRQTRAKVVVLLALAGLVFLFFHFGFQRYLTALKLLLSFAILGFFPLIAKRAVEKLKVQRALASFPKPPTFDYNLVVIGAGSAGLVTAYIAAAVRAKVALVEQHKMGGDCLNTGCVPSKALIRSAKICSYISRARDFGFRTGEIDFDFAEVMERVQRVVRKIEPHDSAERYQQLGVEVIPGKAHILSPYQVQVGGKVLTTRSIVVATGARPFVPPLPGADRLCRAQRDRLPRDHRLGGDALATLQVREDSLCGWWIRGRYSQCAGSGRLRYAGDLRPELR